MRVTDGWCVAFTLYSIFFPLLSIHWTKSAEPPRWVRPWARGAGVNETWALQEPLGWGAGDRPTSTHQAPCNTARVPAPPPALTPGRPKVLSRAKTALC